MIWLYNLVSFHPLFLCHDFCEVKLRKVLIANLSDMVWKIQVPFVSILKCYFKYFGIFMKRGDTRLITYLVDLYIYFGYLYSFMILFGRFICVFVNIYTFNEIHVREN